MGRHTLLVSQGHGASLISPENSRKESQLLYLGSISMLIGKLEKLVCGCASGAVCSAQHGNHPTSAAQEKSAFCKCETDQLVSVATLIW